MPPRLNNAFDLESFARARLEAARAALYLFRYPLPALRTSAEQREPPTVYFCAPDIDYPSGGVRVAYRHADLLNQAGIRAAVLHARRNFRCTWFENRTRVVSSRQTLIGPRDLVVVSEVAAMLLATLPPGFRYVIFNQGPHLTWRLPECEVARYIDSPDLAAIFTVSDHGLELLKYAAPNANVQRLHNSIDPRLFHPGGKAARARRISYMPRRGRDEARQLLGILHSRGALDGWEVSTLEGLREREVADHLRSTTIFLSFAYQEGFGLPAAEAMASGAYVVGFHGFGGREFFRPEFSSPVEPGDIVTFARTLEAVLERETATPGWCAARGSAAAAFIADEYSTAREREDVVNAYAALLPVAGSCQPRRSLVSA